MACCAPRSMMGSSTSAASPASPTSLHDSRPSSLMFSSFQLRCGGVAAELELSCSILSTNERRPVRMCWKCARARVEDMGVLRAVSGCRRAFNRKLAGGVARLMQKVAAVRTDTCRSQHVLCANALKGAYVGYYVATVGVSSSGADRLEAVWRKVFKLTGSREWLEYCEWSE